MSDRTAFAILLLACALDLVITVGLAMSDREGLTAGAAGTAARLSTVAALVAVFLVIGRTRQRKVVAAGLVAVVGVLRAVSEQAIAGGDVSTARALSPLLTTTWHLLLVSVVLGWGIARLSGRLWLVAVLVVPVIDVVASLAHSTWWFAPSRDTDDFLATSLGDLAFATSSWIRFAFPILVGVLASAALCAWSRSGRESATPVGSSVDVA